MLGHITQQCRILCAISILLLGFASSAAASTITLTPEQQGHISYSHGVILGTGINYDPNDTSLTVSYFSFSMLGGVVDEARSFVLFDIPVLGNITDAILHLNASLNAFAGGAGTLAAFDVTSNPAAFSFGYSGNSAAGLALFNDLGDGVQYAAFGVPNGVTSFSFGIPVTTVMNAEGGVLGVGFEGSYFLGPIGLDSVSLDLTTPAAVAEPATGTFAVSAIALLVVLAKLKFETDRVRRPHLG